MRPVAARLLVGALASSVVLVGGLEPVSSAADGQRAAASSGRLGPSGIDPVARAARRVYLVETAHLSLTSEGESTLNERGLATGTFRAPLVARLNLSANHVTAIFTLRLKGGSITGRASARFVVKNSTGYYGGILSIVHGSGSYRHAAGTNIGISGTINRLTFALTVKAHGWITL